MMATAGGLASGAVNCVSPFFVDSAVSSGTATGLAGGLLALGGAIGVVSRVAWGLVADRRGRGSLQLTAILMAIGAIGIGLLGVPSGLPLLLLATALAFGAGSGWSGLFHYAVVRSYPTKPAAATGTVTTGLALGGMIGPMTFGWLITSASYTVAWSFAAILLGLSVVMLMSVRTQLARDRAAS